jgi:hypothetical protein
LLPPDTEPGYLKHYRTGLINAVREAGFTNRFNILKYQLISAKTGFGVEDLITVCLLLVKIQISTLNL